MEKLSRRSLFKAAGAAGAVAAVPERLITPAAAQTEPVAPPTSPVGGGLPAGDPRAGHQDVMFFFTLDEARFVEAAVDRLIPPDEKWPGAVWAGVPEFIDRQLAGAYGVGARMYLEGPWDLGTSQQGYQLPFTPAQLYRTGIQEIRTWLSQREGGGTEFWDLPVADQITILEMLESGEVPLPSMPSSVFFETLLANTIEGWFADPAYGGNQDMISWRMIGFPGAYAQYVDLVTEYNQPYERPPMSMAQSARSHSHHATR
ncbi:gluconate 2-dehydrogenase subunit 3 family protein [Rhodoligotrophos defluvii]|uniref:gluconate 2-dehydrogenase subunit 3 family protein n=1 Tax=Rhodoligotrophos defluvii TaxID=2561934 RepID=UPI0010C9F5BE|nr:gluconate 2-dehydrogenase subunit 3 family protein [Rhodoligotrophos defluvii]